MFHGSLAASWSKVILRREEARNTNHRCLASRQLYQLLSPRDKLASSADPLHKTNLHYLCTGLPWRLRVTSAQTALSKDGPYIRKTPNLLFVLLYFYHFFQVKKVKNPESTDYLGKAQSCAFHVLFHTSGVLFQIFTDSYPIFMCNINEAESTILEINCLWRILFKSVNVSLITCTFWVEVIFEEWSTFLTPLKKSKKSNEK